VAASKVKQLTILLRAPLYSSAQVFYTTRPHRKEPACAFVNTIYLDPATTRANASLPNENHPWNAIITSSHVGVLKAVIERFRAESSTLSEDELRRMTEDPPYALSPIEKQCVAHTSEILLSLSQSIYKFVRIFPKASVIAGKRSS